MLNSDPQKIYCLWLHNELTPHVMLQEMVHHSLQNIIKLIVPQGAMHHLTWSHGEADVNKMETDVVKQQAVVTLYSEKQQKQAAKWVWMRKWSGRHGQQPVFYSSAKNQSAILKPSLMCG